MPPVLSRAEADIGIPLATIGGWAKPRAAPICH